MAAIDLSQFKRFYPPHKPSQFAISVTPAGFVNLSEKLREKLPCQMVGLLMHTDGTQILLDPEEENSFKIIKSGSIQYAEFSRELAAKGITLPARYEAQWDEEIRMWIGTIIAAKNPPKPTSRTKSKLEKPRTTGLKDMMP